MNTESTEGSPKRKTILAEGSDNRVDAVRIYPTEDAAARLTPPRDRASFVIPGAHDGAIGPRRDLPLPDARRMTGAAIAFMALSWGVALGMMGWSYHRILTNKKHHDPDGIGPAQPPVPALTETNREKRV